MGFTCPGSRISLNSYLSLLSSFSFVPIIIFNRFKHSFYSHNLTFKIIDLYKMLTKLRSELVYFLSLVLRRKNHMTVKYIFNFRIYIRSLLRSTIVQENRVYYYYCCCCCCRCCCCCAMMIMLSPI